MINPCFLSFFRFNRQTDPILEREISEVWTERMSKEPWLFNGSKFRLHSFCLGSPHSASLPPSCVPILEADDGRHGKPDVFAGDSLRNSPQQRLDEIKRCQKQKRGLETPLDEAFQPLLTLRLGLTCYKDYLGTNWSARASELRQLGQTEFEDTWALLAQPLGVGAVLCTCDHQVVLIRRSHRVAEAGGLLDIPGGHPEPKVNKKGNRGAEIWATDSDGFYTAAALLRWCASNSAGRRARSRSRWT